MEYHYSIQGYPNGSFTNTRKFINVGKAGQITIDINIFQISTQSYLHEKSYSFFTKRNVPYRFVCQMKGDITIFNCTSCETGMTTYTVEYVPNPGENMFTSTPSLCEYLSTCGIVNNKREVRWNNILADKIYIEEVK